ncbi:S8 family peptidase [Streptomyces luteireticuli]|uniref:S8 family peptidase n=1 Tax=Streptomyces luteireticuli TaxID=173858 RepID=UPI0035566698
MTPHRHPRHRPTAVLLAALALAAAAPAAPGSREPAPAPLHRTSGTAVTGHYIVTLRSGGSPRTLAARLGVTPDIVYRHAFLGFAAKLSAGQLDTVRRAPDVAAVEEDALFHASGSRGPRPGRVAASSWGLDRIDQRNLPLDGQFNVNGTGRGVTAYIVDTGIDYAQQEFGGRAGKGVDLVDPNGDGSDCPTGSGHGTHVSGIVGGAQHGVARGVSLVSVRVLDCGGSTSTARFVQGLDWVAQNADSASVLNASINGPSSSATDSAVNAIANKGILPVVSAGNAEGGADATNACGNSPGGAPGAVPVGATDQTDHMTAFSDWGTCVRLLAPGNEIVSARMGGGTETMSGTSQAAPHVTGVAALYRAAHPDATARAVTDWLTSSDVATQIPRANVRDSTPNRLLYTGGL